MAYQITDACTACGLCLDVCPIGAISEGEPKYVIDDTCCDFEECVVECPEEAIVLVDESTGDDSNGAGAVREAAPRY